MQHGIGNHAQSQENQQRQNWMHCKSCREDGVFTDKQNRRWQSHNSQNAQQKEHGSVRRSFQKIFHLLSLSGFIVGQNFASSKKQHRFRQRVSNHVHDCCQSSQGRKRQSKIDQAHVLHTRISQHAFVVFLN